MHDAMEILTSILAGLAAAGLFLALLICIAGLILPNQTED